MSGQFDYPIPPLPSIRDTHNPADALKPEDRPAESSGIYVHHQSQQATSIESPHQHEYTDGALPQTNSLLEHAVPALPILQPHHRTNRLRKACDACSLRKVKCDEAGPPCRACAALDIPCTWLRPSRRRGPPNRHAEAIKRQRKDGNVHHDMLETTTPPSPTPRVEDTIQPDAMPLHLTAESLCPFDLVELLVDDFFTYIHPLQPFPHEPWFRDALRQRRDLSDRPFLALLAGMIGSLVSSYPRRPRRHLKALGKEKMFPTSTDFVKRCQHIVCQARGPGYLERRDLSAYDAATSYFLFTMCVYTYRFAEGRLYLGECFTIVRCLEALDDDPDRAEGYPTLPPQSPGDNIEREMARRVYWTVFVTIRSSRTINVCLADYINPPTLTRGYPPLPLEIDDDHIFSDHIEPQPPAILARLAGFNLNVRIYSTHDPVIAAELAYSIDSTFDRDRQRRVLNDALHGVKHALNGAPEELTVWPGPSARSSASVDSLHREGTFWDDVFASSQSNATGVGAMQTERRHYIACEVQKANIYGSLLSSRSYFFEKRRALMAPADTEARAAAVAERESIADDLLAVLSSIRPVHMEPNAVSLCMKIRQVASTLLPGELSGAADATDNGTANDRRDGLSERAEGYLRAFLGILMDLEKCGTSLVESESEEEAQDEAELRRWADIREYQKELFGAAGAS